MAILKVTYDWMGSDSKYKKVQNKVEHCKIKEKNTKNLTTFNEAG